MVVKKIPSYGEFKRLLKSRKKVVVMFSASHGEGMCSAIMKDFVEFDDAFPDILFIEVDAEENDKAARDQSVWCVPVFQHFFNGTHVEELKHESSRMYMKKSLDALNEK